MKYTYTGAFGNSPDFQAKAAAWYQSGTECIFGCGGPDNVFAACEATGGDCVSIGVDTDMSPDHRDLPDLRHEDAHSGCLRRD